MCVPFYKRTWIDIDLDKLVANYRTAVSLAPESLVTCVIKSNAYGHGAVRVAQALAQAGCRSFAVSCAREGLELRKHQVQGEILVMGLTEAPLLPAAMEADLTLTAASCDDLLAIDSAAAQVKKTAVVHLKVNTGFHRLGIDVTREAASAVACVVKNLQHTRVQGLFSHLGLVNQARDEMQNDILLRMRDWLKEEGVTIDEVHICDSIGLVRYPQWHYSRVRVGALLFGVRPSRTEHMPFDDYETLAFRTTVAQIHDVKAGEVVGYGDDMILERDSRIATLCAGYGDGYPRHLSNGKGQVSICGKLAPVVGLVCMDQMMVDVTDIPDAQVGDTVDLLGGAIPYRTYAGWAKTNVNEAITIMSRRPVRVYHQGGKIVTVLDSMLEERRDFE